MEKVFLFWKMFNFRQLHYARTRLKFEQEGEWVRMSEEIFLRPFPSRANNERQYMQMDGMRKRDNFA